MRRRLTYNQRTLAMVLGLAAAGTAVGAVAQAWGAVLAGWSGLAVGLLAWYLRGR